MQHLDTVFAALGDTTRRAILKRRRRAPATVTEGAKLFDVSLNAISRHIKVLERAGLVTRERVGREHRLSLRARPLGAAANWFRDYESFWEQNFDRMQAILDRTT